MTKRVPVPTGLVATTSEGGRSQSAVNAPRPSSTVIDDDVATTRATAPK